MQRSLLNLLLIISCMPLALCRPARVVSAAENLPEIRDLNQLPALKKAVYITPSGKRFIMTYEPSVETDIGSESDLDALGVPPSGAAGSGGSTNRSCDATGCPEDCQFDGSKRADAKTTISSGTTKTYATVKSFLTRFADLHPDTDMPVIIGSNNGRVPLEDFNADIKKAWLFCYAKESDEDYHLVIGNLKDINDPDNRFMIVEVGGLPKPNEPARATLETVQSDFFDLMEVRNLCTSGYIWFDEGNSPLKIRVKGSVYWDIEHWHKNLNKIGAHGPESLSPRLTTVWELHPVTKIKQL